MSEPHTSELNAEFLRYLYIYIYISYVVRSVCFSNACTLKVFGASFTHSGAALVVEL